MSSFGDRLRTIDVRDVQADPLVLIFVLEGLDDIRHVVHEARKCGSLVGILLPTLEHNAVAEKDKSKGI